MRLEHSSRQIVLVLLSAITCFLGPIVLIELNVLHFTHGIISYPIDDAFIHMAIGKNLAINHTWGINQNEFVSAASSLLYPLLVALGFKIFGFHLFIPLLLNILAGISILAFLQKNMQKQGISPIGQFIVLLAVIIITPLPVLAMCGMEHTFQLLFSLCFIYTFSENLSSLALNYEKEWKLSWKVYLYGLLLVATRYEGIYLIGVSCLILLFHRKLFLSFQLGLLSTIPIILFGLLSVYKGSYFFPNSVLLKSGAPSLTLDGLSTFITNDFFFRISNSITGYNTISAQRLLFILPLTYLLFLRQLRENQQYHYILVILMSATLFHLSFTGFANFPRYEAYLIGSSAAIVSLLLVKYGRELIKDGATLLKGVIAFAILIMLYPILLRSRNAFRDIGQANVNIYEQQFQMSQFLKEHYYNSAVAIGDIGAVSYYTIGRKFDIVGLANLDIARSKRNHYYTGEYLNWLSKKDSVKIAICYDYFTSPDLLQHWTKTATWEIPNNVACGDAVVSFYAVNPADKLDLLHNLQSFQKKLPPDILVNYY